MTDAQELAGEQSQRSAKKREFIRAWVETHGSANQQERLAAGLLNWKEALTEIEDELNLLLWQPLIERGLKPFSRLAQDKYPHTCAGSHGFACEVVASVRRARTATAWEWDAMKIAREQFAAVLEQARSQEHNDTGLFWHLHSPEVVLRRHEATCVNLACHGGTLENAGLSLRIQVGPFGFAREFAV